MQSRQKTHKKEPVNVIKNRAVAAALFFLFSKKRKTYEYECHILLYGQSFIFIIKMMFKADIVFSLKTCH